MTSLRSLLSGKHCFAHHSKLRLPSAGCTCSFSCRKREFQTFNLHYGNDKTCHAQCMVLPFPGSATICSLHREGARWHAHARAHKVPVDIAARRRIMTPILIMPRRQGVTADILLVAFCACAGCEAPPISICGRKRATLTHCASSG